MEVLRFSHEKNYMDARKSQTGNTQIKLLEEFSMFFYSLVLWTEFGGVQQRWKNQATCFGKADFGVEPLWSSKKQLHEISFLSSDDTDNTLNSTSAE